MSIFWIAWGLCVAVFIILVPRCPDRRPFQDVMIIILILLIVLPISVGIIKDIFYHPCPVSVPCLAPVVCPPCNKDMLQADIDAFLLKHPKYKKWFYVNQRQN